MPNQPFDAEEWLNSKKKGISGKVPRADFIVKMKELGAEIEKQKKDLEIQLKTSQTELTTRDQIIKDKDKQITEFKTSAEQTKQELTTKLAEQEEKLKNLQERPDITQEKYQELLNNQEEHKEKDLKPTNLPADWEKQLSDKKTIEKNFADTEKKLSAIEEKLSTEQKNFSQLEAKLIEYKDYDNLKIELEKVKKELQNKDNEPKENIISQAEYKKLNQQLQTEQEKNRVLAEKLSVLPPPTVQLGKDKEEIIKGVGKLLTDTINPLWLEIAELKKQSPNNSLPDYKKIKAEKEEALRILKLVGSKIEK